MKPKAITGIMLTLFLASIAFSTLPVLATSSTITNVDTGETFTTVQGAIDDPDTLDGHTLLVGAGTYYENVHVHKSLTLEGENPSTTIIDGSGAGNVFLVTADDVSISGFTVQDSGEWTVYEAPAGILLDYVIGSTIVNNNISNNNGYGIFVVKGNDNNVSDNSVTFNLNYGINVIDSSNNNIVGNNITNNWIGTVLWGSSNNNIVGNNITANYENSIGLHSSSNNNIVGNNITNNGFGITLYESSNNNSICRNNITANNDVGIRLDGSSNNTLSRNSITEHNYNGIDLWSSSNYNSISGNNITENNWCGVGLYGSSNNHVSGNNITANNDVGIGLWSSSNHNTVSGNTVSNNLGTGVGLWEGPLDNHVSGNTVSNNLGTGIGLWSSSNHNTVSGNNVTANNVEAILLEFSSNNTVSENNITNNGFGITLYESSNYNSMSGNNITASNYWGIRLDSSNYNSISGNNITANNENGIWLGGSNYNSISGNNITATNKYNGIGLGDSSNNAISGNTVSNNLGHGVGLWSSSNYNTVSGNDITANKYNGIGLGDSSNNTLTRNNITENSGDGIGLYNSLDNVICHNNIIDNGVQASDSVPAENDWHHPVLLEGNYWSDYTGVDDGSGTGKHAIAGDGIGDTDIPWPDTDYDFYPFVKESGWVRAVETTDETGERKDVFDIPETVYISGRGYLPSSACMSDPAGDWIGGLGNSYTDITSACILQVDEDTIQVEMTVVGNIPFSDSDFDHFLGFVWGLDLNENGIFSEFPPYAEEYVDANIRVAHDPLYGWQAFIDGRPEVGMLSGFAIIENKVTFSFPMSYIGNPTSFRWETGALEATFDGADLPSDLAPNPGLPRALWLPITLDLYIVEDTTWSDGMDIPDRVSGTETSVTTDANGNIPAGAVAWNGPLTPGKYDIIIDVNSNGKYDEGIDALDDEDIEVTAGFFVIPEYPLGTVVGLAMCLAALAVYQKRFKHLVFS